MQPPEVAFVPAAVNFLTSYPASCQAVLPTDMSICEFIISWPSRYQLPQPTAMNVLTSYIVICPVVSTSRCGYFDQMAY
jgi:hypothetical protein